MVTRGISPAAPDAALLDAVAATAQLRDAQREVLRLRDEVQSVADRLRLVRESVVWSGAAADAWRATLRELGQDGSRGVDALDELHRLVGVVITRIEEGVPG